MLAVGGIAELRWGLAGEMQLRWGKKKTLFLPAEKSSPLNSTQSNHA